MLHQREADGPRGGRPSRSPGERIVLLNAPRGRRARTSRAGRARGQSLVEFALVLPIMLLILSGIVDFGIGLTHYMTLISATREGARLAVTNCTGTDCAGAVRAKTIAAATGISPTVTVTCSAGACASSTSGQNVTVRSTWTYNMIWPVAFGTEIPLAYSITMMLE